MNIKISKTQAEIALLVLESERKDLIHESNCATNSWARTNRFKVHAECLGEIIAEIRAAIAKEK